jgi:hypothetical protein
MQLCSGAPDDEGDDAVMEKHGGTALYSAVKWLMHEWFLGKWRMLRMSWMQQIPAQ